VKPQIVDAADVQRRPRKSPATRMIEGLPPDLLTARQVAERFDRNIETIRRLARPDPRTGEKRFKAPSKAIKSGELIIWVYTPEDVDELAEHFGEKVSRKRATRKGSR